MDATLQALLPKQRKAVEALLTTGEVTAATQAVGISRATLHRWLGEPAFLEAVRAAEARAADAALARLLQVRELAALEARVAALEEAAGLAEGQ